MANTPVRPIRIDDGRWNSVQERAAAEGKGTSDVVRDALDRYLETDIGPKTVPLAKVLDILEAAEQMARDGAAS